MTSRAWAVRVKWTHPDPGEKPFLAGRYWFCNVPHPSHEGCEVALFTTRKAAQSAIDGVWAKREWYKCRPVRVEVRVKETR